MRLNIWMGGHLVGVLDDSDRRRPRVTYEQQYLRAADATPLSVSMPLSGRVYAGTRVAAYLWGLLPDNPRVIERWATLHQCSSSNVVALLAHVGADVAGAAQYVPEGEVSEESRNGVAKALSEAEVAGLLAELRRDATAWHPSSGGRWSLAGAQAKLALARDEHGNWSEPAGAAPTTHILKPAIPGLGYHELNEHLCLTAAGRLGIPAAVSSVERFGKQYVLVVERYDRTLHDGTLQRVHQEDFCQALGVHPERKYESDGGPGVEQMLAVLDSVGRSRSIDVRRLVDALILNWLLLGTDAHAKNYSLLLAGPQVRIAPLYDLASAAPYPDMALRPRLAQRIGGEYRPGAVGVRHWQRVAKGALLDADGVVGRVRELAAALPQALSDARRSTALPRTFRKPGAEILDAITAWVQTCVRNLDSGPTYSRRRTQPPES